MRYNKTSLMMLAVCSALLPAGIAMAQQPSAEGVVQLGHRAQARKAAKQYRVSADHCDGCGPTASGHGGACRHHRAAGINGGHYGYGGNPHYSHCGIGHWLNQHSPYHTCTHSPDHGWAPPLHRPMYPTPAIYGRMFPSQWTGETAGIDPGFRHPMVYMPTDTTQLGYYYQQVPYWRSRPNMIPPVPNPDEWHTPNLGVVFTGFEDAAEGALTGCPVEGVVDHGPSSYGDSMDGSYESYPTESMPLQASPVPLFESVPGDAYSPAPLTPQMVPPMTVPSAEENAPAPPAGLPPIPSNANPAVPAAPAAPEAPAAADLERSAALPLLIPVPPQ